MAPGAHDIGAGFRCGLEGSVVGRRLLDELPDEVRPSSGILPLECLPSGRDGRGVRELPKPFAEHHARKPLVLN